MRTPSVRVRCITRIEGARGIELQLLRVGPQRHEVLTVPDARGALRTVHAGDVLEVDPATLGRARSRPAKKA